MTLLLGLATALVCPLPALDPGRQVTQYGLRSWSPEDSLPTGTVWAMAQTTDGWFWVGTDEGLARFDGVNFTRVAGDTAGGRPVRQVTALQPGDADDLWVGTRGSGLLRWHQGKLAPFPGAVGEPGQDITALARDRDGALWIGTRTSGLYQIQGGGCRRFTTADGLPSAAVVGLNADSQGGIWASTSDGQLTRLGAGQPQHYTPSGPGPTQCLRVAIRDRQGGLWTGLSGAQVDNEYGDLLYSVSIQQPDGFSYENSSFIPGIREEALTPLPILEDRQGLVWFGTRKGVVRISEGRMEILNSADGLPDDFVTSLREDREGNLWVGTRLGVTRIRDNLITPFTRRQGLLSDRVLAVSEGVSGTIWVGTDCGLNKIVKGRVVPYKPKELVGTWVYDVLRTRDAYLWLATRRGVVRAHGQEMRWLNARDGFSADVVHTLCEDLTGTLWAGMTTRGIASYKNGVLKVAKAPTNSPLQQVNDLACAPDGTIWAATRGGLGRLRDGTLEEVPLVPELSGRELSCLHIDATGAIWAGTQGGGLLRLRGDGGRAITTRQGLWHDTVLAILEDGEGNLWMASPQGVFHAPKSQLEAVAEGRSTRVECIHYGTDDGMRSVECLPGGCRSSDGRLWFCTNRGLCMIQPESLLTPLPAPPLRMVELMVDNHPCPPEQTEFGPGIREIELRFAALSYRAPEQIRFRCRLEGFDRDWSAPFADRKIRYTTLPPGEYTLHLQAHFPNAPWSGDGITVPFAIRPPLWRQAWFQVLALAGLVIVILAAQVGVVRLRRLVKDWRTTHYAGPYRLLEVVGKGGMGTVWRAVHRKTGQELAVKTLDTLSGDEVMRERFIREGLACERINHPAVVKVFARGESQGRLWYAMEFCHGSSLRSCIAHDEIPPARAVTIFRRLLEAVRAIHAGGVIHRDLKPENIFMESVPPDAGDSAGGTTESVRVLDFGLARLSDRQTRTSAGLPAGTLAYLPPEYLGSGGKEDAAVDFYALGVILYEMLTGAPPFSDAGDDPVSVLYAVLNEDPIPPAEVDHSIPADLSDLALRLIAREPEQRLKSAEEIEASLSSLSISQS